MIVALWPLPRPRARRGPCLACRYHQGKRQACAQLGAGEAELGRGELLSLCWAWHSGPETPKEELVICQWSPVQGKPGQER